MFSSLSNSFSAFHCGAEECVGWEVIFQVCPALMMGRPFVLPVGVGRGENPPHFRGDDCCCRELSSVLASAKDPRHGAG